MVLKTYVNLIIIICGLPGVGKTTLSKEIAPLLNALILSTDKIRKDLFPRPNYSIRERRLVYDVLLLLTKYLNDAGVNCILDATFSQERSRLEVKRRLNIPANEVHIVECVCPENIVVDRLKNRKHDFSDADINIYEKMKKIYEPVKENHLTVDTSKVSKADISIIASKLLKQV